MVLLRLAENLRNSHVLLGSWPKASRACNVLTPGGKPNPGLAQMIAEKDYEPKLLATRMRLGLPPVCPECHQRLPKPPRPARVVRFDPALETVDWSGWGFINGLVCGGESGSNAREMPAKAAVAARQFCRMVSVPFTFKQWGPRGEGQTLGGVHYQEFPEVKP